MTRILAACAGLSSLLVSSVVAAATVVSDANVSLGAGGLHEFALTVYQDAAATDFTSMFFDYDGTSIEFGTTNIDEGSEWYAVVAGDAFTTQNIEAGLFPLLAPGAPIPAGPGSFFVGVNTGQGIDAAGPDRSVLGWVELSSTGGELVLLGSAVAYDFAVPGARGNGIVVGTTTALPEPSTFSLLALGLIALGRTRRASART